MLFRSNFREVKRNKQSSLTTDINVLFRGKNNVEAGLDLIAKCSSNLPSNIHLTVITDYLKSDQKFSENTKVILGYISNEMLWREYFECDVVIGQMGSISRINRSIPHKAFEAAYFGRTYISQDSKAMREVFPNSSQVYFISELSENNQIGRAHV